MRGGARLRPFLLLLLLVSTALSAACGRSIADALDDTTITTRVKTAILNDPVVGGRGIDVQTSGGVVTLSGRVRSQAERQQVLALARGADGVADVKDALQIVPEVQPAPRAQ